MVGNPLVPIAVPCVSKKVGHSCSSALGAGAAVPTGARWAGKGEDDACCEEEEGQSRAGSLQRCTLPTQGHSDGVSLGQCHCRQWDKAKNIWHYYTKLFLLHKSWLLWMQVKPPMCTVV